VADEATRILREAGVRVIREDASLLRPDRLDERFRVKVAVFLHFDGDNEDGVELGASVSYDHESDAPVATAWKQLYSKYWPYKWENDNYTPGLRGYYGFRYTITSDGEFVIEFGDCETRTQAEWLKPRLKWLGALLAHFLSTRTGLGSVPLPKFPTDEDFRLFDARGNDQNHIPGPRLPQSLPDYARAELGPESGVPWQKAAAMSQFNPYNGIVRDSFYLFHNLQEMPEGVTAAAIYECRFTIDNDGIGGNPDLDPNHQDATTLLTADGISLNANDDSYAVLPLDAAEAAEEHRRDPGVALKHAGLPDFGKDLGLRLGDIGAAFWRQSSHGDVAHAFFIYGDKGSANNLGEGSIQMADRLKINSNPRNGGFNTRDIMDMGKGITHIGFVGSGAAFGVANRKNRTTLTAAEVSALGEKLLAAFKNQPA
jgi:hypothetical protein